MLRYIRLVSFLLILVIAASPAFAAVCATSCATKSIMSTVNADDMSNMPNCHQVSKEKGKSTPNIEHPNIEHKSCSMGAGCNFSQATPIALPAKFVHIDLPSSLFLSFDSSAKSADLTPPLKPPA